MDEDKLKKLDEKLYNETPFLGDRIKQQALKDLLEIRNIQAIEYLTKAFIYHQQSSFGKIISKRLSQLKIQEIELVNAVCRVWAEERDPQLAKMLKLKGWTASRPIKLRLLTAINLGWEGVLEEKGVSIIKPLLGCFHDRDTIIANTARQWSQNLKSPALQSEVCRLAVEENDQIALEVATQNGYLPSEPEQCALFYYFTQQWEEYRQHDPDSVLLEEIYYQSSSKLQKRIDDHGQKLRRLEWIWLRIGGHEGRKLAQIKYDEWNIFLRVLFQGRHWEVALSLMPYFPAIYSKAIVQKLVTKRSSFKDEQTRAKLGEIVQVWKKMLQETPPQGNLVRSLHTLKGHQQSIEAFVITPDSQTLISAGGKNIRFWDLKQGTFIKSLKGHLKSVSTLFLNSQGSLLASGSRDRSVSLWRLPQGDLATNVSPNSGSVWSLTMTDDGRTIVTAGYRDIKLWRYPPGKLEKTLSEHTREVNKLILNHQENLLISGGGKKDHSIRIWSLPEGEPISILTGHQDSIWDLVISPDDRLLASAGKDKMIKLWSIFDGENIHTLTAHQGEIWCLAITPDGQKLISGSNDRTAKIWNWKTGELIFDLIGHEDAIVCLDVSHDGRLLATGSKDATVKLWNIDNGKLMNTLTGHQGGISRVKFSPNGETLITGSEDRTIQLWRWDLSRLAQIPLKTITNEDKMWLQQVSSNPETTPEEQQWSSLILKLLSF